MPQPYKLFTIYAREDAQYLEELRGQLRPLEHAGRIKVWSDREINPGVDWEREIVQNLDTADIILILVSAAYYNSAYIHKKEITHAMTRHERGEAKVLPVIVRPCSFLDDPVISRLQVLPTDGKPVNSHHWRERDDAWLDVVAGVKRVLNELEKRENSQARNKALDVAREWGFEVRQIQQIEKQEQDINGSLEKKNIETLTLRRYGFISAGVLISLLLMWAILKNYGSGRESQLQYAEEAAFNATDSINTIAAWRDFLQKYSNGSRRLDAQRYLDSLQESYTRDISDARIFLKEKDTSSARSLLQNAIRMNPDDTEATQLLNSIPK